MKRGFVDISRQYRTASVASLVFLVLLTSLIISEFGDSEKCFRNRIIKLRLKIACEALLPRGRLRVHPLSLVIADISKGNFRAEVVWQMDLDLRGERIIKYSPGVGS